MKTFLVQGNSVPQPSTKQMLGLCITKVVVAESSEEKAMERATEYLRQRHRDWEDLPIAREITKEECAAQNLKDVFDRAHEVRNAWLAVKFCDATR